MFKNYKKGVDEILIEAENHRMKNELLLALEKYNEALFFLENEDKIEVLFVIADIYGELENYVDANNIYEEILSIDSENSGAWYGIAFTNELLGKDVLLSLDAYEKAIELDKNYKEAYYYAATIYGDLDNQDKAIEYLNKVIEIDPDDFVAYNDLGATYEHLKDYEKAKEYLFKSIQINNNYYLSHFNLGVVYKALGDYDSALKSYEESKKYSDTRFNYLNMSAIYIERKEFEEAIKILTEGISRREHHILYYNRACSYKKLGNIEKALEDFEKAYEMDEVVLEWAKKDPDLKDIIEENYDYN